MQFSVYDHKNVLPVDGSKELRMMQKLLCSGVCVRVCEIAKYTYEIAKYLK